MATAVEYTSPEVASVIGLVDTFNRWKNSNDGPRGFESYHPSAFGNCLRKMQYERYAERGYVESVKTVADAFMCRIWANGHSMHDRWRSYFEELGVLKGYWQCTNPFCCAYDDDGKITSPESLQLFQDNEWKCRSRTYGKDMLQGCFKPEKCICGGKRFIYHEISVVSKELNFYGHCDMIIDFSDFDPKKLEGIEPQYLPEYLPKRPVVIDMKTINMFSFQDLAKKGPNFEYQVQLTIYANLLDCDFGILIYENKNNQKTAVFKVDKNTDTVFAEVQRQSLAMNEMVDVVDGEGNVHHLLPPPRPSFPSCEECGRCSFASQCHSSDIWNDPDLNKKREEFYGTLLK